MSRKRYALSKQAQERWPELWNSLGAYFGQDYLIIHGSIEGALEGIVTDFPTEHRRTMLRQWRVVTDEIAWKTGFDHYLGDAFGVAMRFDDDADARGFWKRFYDRMIESVRRDTAP